MILGENGAGKTTMLKLLIGDLQLPEELEAARAGQHVDTKQGDEAEAEAKALAKANKAKVRS